MSEIFSTIRQEVRDYVNNYIEIVPGYDFSMYETIKRVHLTQNSEFENKEEFGGRPKMFFNISNKRKNDVASFLDVDTNQIRVEELVPQSFIPSRILETKVREILKRDRYTEKFNDMADELASFGYVCLEHKKSGAEIVDLRRLFVDPTVDSIKDSRFIIIKEYFTPEQLRAQVKNGWDERAIEAIIEKHDKTGAPESYEDEGTQNEIVSTPYIQVYRRFGLVPEGELDGTKSTKLVRSFMAIAEPFLTRTTQTGQQVSDGEVLFKSRWNKDYPFEDTQLFKVKGRLMGIGVYELLFQPQERINEIMNQRRIAGDISSMHIFQTADPLVFNNILTDLQNGDVIKTKSQGSLQPLVNEERNLSYFQMEEESYINNANDLTNAGGLGTGENAPTSMPATNAAIIQNNTLRVQQIRRESFVAFIRRFILNFILPQAVTELDNTDLFKYVADSADIEALDRVVLANRFADHQIAMMLKGKPILAPFVEEERAKLEKKFKQEGTARYIRSIKDYWKSHKDSFDINIDAEQRDVAVIANNTFAFISAYAQNPALLEDPVQREFARQWAKDIGLDSVRLDIALAKRDAQMQERQVQQESRGKIKAETESVVNKDEEVKVK